MIRKEEVRPKAHTHAPVQRDPAGGQRIVFVEKLKQVQDHAVTEQTPGAVVKDPRGNLVKNEFEFADVDGVSSIGSTLIAGNDLYLFGEDVDDLSLPFIAPLTPHHDRTAAFSIRHGDFAPSFVNAQKKIRPPWLDRGADFPNRSFGES